MFHRALSIAALLGISLSACAAPAPPPDARTFSFTDGAGSSAWVRRTAGRDGGETLHGETSVVSGATVTHVVEDAELDARGRLVQAEIAVGCGGPTEEHVVLDVAHGAVRATMPGGPVSWPVPTDAPWAYAPMARGVSTPIAAWITMRAAEGAPRVRILEVDGRSSHTTVPDQIAIPTELGTTVVLGGDGADVDGTFVDSLRLLDRGIALHRLDRPDGAPSAIACAPSAPAGVGLR